MTKNLINLTLAIGLLCSLYATPSLAELGGVVDKDAVLVQEQSSVVAAEPRLTVYQIKSPSGTLIREYTNANNVVVGVTWQGPTLPNLKQLLGTHFDTFVNRPITPGAGHRSAELRTDELVVQSHGQMRSFSGRAYLPKMLPAGFNIDQIN
ncbi:hypothetical protein AAKU67_000956 [Oxalobacteraceae bacterium GrIS 2.11]